MKKTKDYIKLITLCISATILPIIFLACTFLLNIPSPNGFELSIITLYAIFPPVFSIFFGIMLYKTTNKVFWPTLIYNVYLCFLSLLLGALTIIIDQTWILLVFAFQCVPAVYSLPMAPIAALIYKQKMKISPDRMNTEQKVSLIALGISFLLSLTSITVFINIENATGFFKIVRYIPLLLFLFSTPMILVCIVLFIIFTIIKINRATQPKFDVPKGEERTFLKSVKRTKWYLWIVFILSCLFALFFTLFVMGIIGLTIITFAVWEIYLMPYFNWRNDYNTTEIAQDIQVCEDGFDIYL